ncbi:hypothetical protein HQ325_16550 [Rhodococcus sp. BP-349]|nr:hypothetical protein [Rhodococcus sp. BP-363]MBY6545689.1 hypothetical protein [Rhodococcus sp. BP-369]MBY6564919.1 hypothetical protein [Rhodococcus sp. BP-370]MBY6578145.1 hypothetical protein [Rhodococcus sp. BP-364]MBY6587446.1 hypothetical protein [Rhodococcus sp. BP-358]MBY6591783.1 hypothetical protein [Rhodococcus sp. BP-362]MBY6597186.1 hypothetical protein [Rhodococcus sp. BP-359]MBY6601525.1 hypothetical protein [Rhodococcus sp. BP-353]MBY6604796.1 hypothetical protein [Rhodoc
MLYSSTPPAVMILLFAGTVWALGILGAAWLVLTVVGWIKYRAWKLASIAVAIVAATAVLVVLSVPFRVAFAVSKGPLTDIATACSATPAGGWAGAYELDGVSAVDGGCLIYVEGGFLDQVGFAYMPDGAPKLGPPDGEQQIGYAGLDGDWYTFVHRF